MLFPWNYCSSSLRLHIYIYIYLFTAKKFKYDVVKLISLFLWNLLPLWSSTCSSYSCYYVKLATKEENKEKHFGTKGLRDKSLSVRNYSILIIKKESKFSQVLNSLYDKKNTDKTKQYMNYIYWWTKSESSSSCRPNHKCCVLQEEEEEEAPYYVSIPWQLSVKCKACPKPKGNRQ